jgi:hypothetical protein
VRSAIESHVPRATVFPTHEQKLSYLRELREEAIHSGSERRSAEADRDHRKAYEAAPTA